MIRSALRAELHALRTPCLAVWLLALAACGGSSSDNPTTRLLGGTIQGKDLALAGVVTTVLGNGFGYVDGDLATAQFEDPGQLTTDGQFIYVTDQDNHSIRKLDLVAGAVTTLAGSATGEPGDADGTGTEARFTRPFGLTCDGPNLYVADSQNQKVRKVVIATGEVTTLAGTADTTVAADGTGPDAHFVSPYGLTTDNVNLYLTDHYDQTIRKIVIATAEVSTLAGAHATPGAVDATGTDARFDDPIGITTDGTNLYVADSQNFQLRKVVISTGEVTTLAGSSGATDLEGPGADVAVGWVEGLTTDGTSLYFSDWDYYLLRRLDLETLEVTTVAGHPGEDGTADGTGADARFEGPLGLVSDGTSLYLADYDAASIRKIQ